MRRGLAMGHAPRVWAQPRSWFSGHVLGRGCAKHPLAERGERAESSAGTAHRCSQAVGLPVARRESSNVQWANNLRSPPDTRTTRVLRLRVVDRAERRPRSRLAPGRDPPHRRVVARELLERINCLPSALPSPPYIAISTPVGDTPASHPGEGSPAGMRARRARAHRRCDFAITMARPSP